MNKFKTQFIIKSSLLFIALIASLCGYQYFRLMSWTGKPVSLPAAVVVEVPKGIALRQLAEKLEVQGVIDDRRMFTYWLKIQRLFPQFQAGTYQFSEPTTPQQVIDKMMAGDVHRPLVLSFTIPEGFTLKQIIDRLAALGVDKPAALLRLTSDSAFIASLLGMEAESLEGFLYPATYRFYESMPEAREVVTTLVREFFSRLPANYQQLLEPFKINLYQAVTIASMIEKETLHESEMPLVAEVIWNRLRARMPLAIDATLIYGIEDYRGNILTRHLRDAKNRYNTRIHAGLPPTPIGSVSRSALEALVKPANEGNYYYVLLPGEGKKHHFSKTLNEHNKYVRKLVQALKAGRTHHP